MSGLSLFLERAKSSSFGGIFLTTGDGPIWIAKCQVRRAKARAYHSPKCFYLLFPTIKLCKLHSIQFRLE